MNEQFLKDDGEYVTHSRGLSLHYPSMRALQVLPSELVLHLQQIRDWSLQEVLELFHIRRLCRRIHAMEALEDLPVVRKKLVNIRVVIAMQPVQPLEAVCHWLFLFDMTQLSVGSFTLFSRIAQCTAVACTTCSRRIVAGRAKTLSEIFACFTTLPFAMLPDRFTQLLLGTFGRCWLGLLCIRFFNFVWLCCHNIFDGSTDGALLFREHPPLIDTCFV